MKRIGLVLVLITLLLAGSAVNAYGQTVITGTEWQTSLPFGQVVDVLPQADGSAWVLHIQEQSWKTIQLYAMDEWGYAPVAFSNLQVDQYPDKVIVRQAGNRVHITLGWSDGQNQYIRFTVNITQPETEPVIREWYMPWTEK